ncbi:hypothetical protein [Agromyces aureus]|uniref:Uncharacterized protein n=1 Tax=Agromyces aureus TaxID=453304 RepID=A0A191WF62_9MICO|nr:hypothetical protein [Agromyces aureus]ANJ26828.1 hypothetical protein ATC03_08950 [Agromyces aureus]
MAGITGWTNTPDTFDPAPQIDAVYGHIDAKLATPVANAAALPASGNWIGRQLMASDTGIVWVCTALPGTWKRLALADDSGWTALTLNGSWTANGGGTNPPLARVLNGHLEITGLIDRAAPAGGTAFTLPVGMRPVKTAVVLAFSNSGACGLFIPASGVVDVISTAGTALTGAVTSISLTIPPLPIL